MGEDHRVLGLLRLQSLELIRPCVTIFTTKPIVGLQRHSDVSNCLWYREMGQLVVKKGQARTKQVTPLRTLGLGSDFNDRQLCPGALITVEIST